MTDFLKSSDRYIAICLIIFFFAGLGSTIAQTDDYIIVYKSHKQKQNTAKQKKFNVRRSFNIIPALSARIDANELEQLRKDPDVELIEPDYKIYALGNVAGEPSSDMTLLSSSQTIPYGISLVNAPAAWTKTRGASVRVAVLDTGISMYHPDAGNVVSSTSFVEGETVEDFYGHGTHTAGTIAAPDNGIGVVGVAPESELLIAKILDSDGSGQTSWLISGIEWAVSNNAKVISMSLGGSDYSSALDSACENALAAGVLLVAAAGNDNTDTPFYPAALSSVISVSAVNQNKTKASFSNYGSTVELAAPGVNIYSTVASYNIIDGEISAAYDMTGDAIWNNTSHTSTPAVGTAVGSASGLICDCGLATGTTTANTCPDSVAGNVALIRRGTTTFAQKVAHAKSKGAVGVIIANNTTAGITPTLSDVTPLVAVMISQADGDALQMLAAAGITGTVSVDATLYDYYNGTSMACPHVSGVAALIFAADGSDITPAEVRSILADSAQDLGTAGRDVYFGYGLVDADAALDLIVPQTCAAVHTLGHALAGDINQDCFVNLQDLQLLAAQWLDTSCSSSNQWCNGGDISNNGAVNLDDFSKLALQWLTCNDPQDPACI